ncbi:hypothetical protein [Atopobium fossor]|uniref:hypothetical protein n=1 Tax=Atopobium fossor TaxID=39487 RepID=UPI0003F9A4DE|nr:hypothetical protein [Atopobium fossor]
MNPVTLTIASRSGKTATLYRHDSLDVYLPLIVLNARNPSASELFVQCQELDCKPFNLLVISGFDWNNDLSPWQSDSVMKHDGGFAGYGPKHLDFIVRQALPAVFTQLGFTKKDTLPPCYLAGYSLAGLFALWAQFETDVFSGGVSSSGSLWFPGFFDFAVTQSMLKTKYPKIEYLSLGSRESKTRHPLLSQSEQLAVALSSHFKKQGAVCTFELNLGGRFTDEWLRLAKGITWLLQEVQTKTEQ